MIHFGVWAVLWLFSWGQAESRGIAGAWVLDDFEDGDRTAASGLSWFAITDALRGGGSRARLTVIDAGDGGLRKALRVTGEVAPKGYAGVWTAIAPGGRSADVSAFTGIRVRARGRGTFAAGLRSGPKGGANFMARFAAKPDWSVTDIPFGSLEFPGVPAPSPGAPPPRFDPRDVRWLGVQAVEPGAYEIEIDDVALVGSPGSPPSAPAYPSAPAFAIRAPYVGAEAVEGAAWRQVATDLRGDGRQPTLPDAVRLELWRDDPGQLLWFRIVLASPPAEEGIGVNLALDLDEDSQNGTAWWGSNAKFHFDRLVTVWVFDTGVDWQGQVGIADAVDVKAGNMMAGTFGRPLLILDRKSNAVVVGLPRAALGTGPPARVVAAVGSPLAFNDDVPSTGSVAVGR
jgi:Complex I intermediate-associated protein 30 (CIA30)